MESVLTAKKQLLKEFDDEIRKTSNTLNFIYPFEVDDGFLREELKEE